MPGSDTYQPKPRLCGVLAFLGLDYALFLGKLREQLTKFLPTVVSNVHRAILAPMHASDPEFEGRVFLLPVIQSHTDIPTIVSDYPAFLFLPINNFSVTRETLLQAKIFDDHWKRLAKIPPKFAENAFLDGAVPSVLRVNDLVGRFVFSFARIAVV